MPRESVDSTAGRGAFDVVAIATSAGGLKALSHVLSSLPQDFPPAIVVVQHTSTRAIAA